jgi:hypothetical protein
LNGSKSSIVVFILGMSVMLILLSVSQYSAQHPSISTVPSASEAQAVKAVQDDLQSREADFKNPTIYVSDVGYMTFQELQAKGYHLPLVYSHPNGTLFFINSTTHEISSKCTPSEQNPNCSWSKLFAEKTAAKLAYGVDIYWFNQKGIATSDYYLVEAKSGDVLFSFIKSKT